MKDKTWVIIPAHNESERIKPVIEEAKEYVDNVVVVDGGSEPKHPAIRRHMTPTTQARMVNSYQHSLIRLTGFFRRGNVIYFWCQVLCHWKKVSARMV